MVQRIVSSLGQDICRAATKGQQRRFILFAFSSASSPPEIVLWTVCKFWTFPGSDVTVWEFFVGNFKSLHSCLSHGWQKKLSSTLVFSLSVLPHYATSSVNRVCHQFRSAMIMPWAVCPSRVFKNWSKLPNSKWNADGAAGFTTIWVDRRFGDPSNPLTMAAGLTTIWWTEGLRIPAMLWQCPRVYNYLSGQKVWELLLCFGNGRRVYNYLSGQKVS